jgi:uncharacterized protein YdeI (YjbR/CyaY-like superfamily)
VDRLVNADTFIESGRPISRSAAFKSLSTLSREISHTTDTIAAHVVAWTLPPRAHSKLQKMKLNKLQQTKPTIRFSAKLSRPKANEKNGSWTLTLPKTASAKLPSRGTTMVEGTINSFPFRAALEPNGKGTHSLSVNKTMRDAADADAGDTVTVEIARAGEEPEMRVPLDLRKALAASPLAQAGWEDIAPMARRDWIFSISSAKQPETRRRRIEKACDMLASGKRRLCCFPGIKWLMKKNEKSCGMWLQLPNSKNRSSLEPTSPD